MQVTDSVGRAIGEVWANMRACGCTEPVLIAYLFGILTGWPLKPPPKRGVPPVGVPADDPGS